jgi:2-polyprenyl-3-methyl-5-hydroxy-6-metoxy-1,4-benzoquinol methylase
MKPELRNSIKKKVLTSAWLAAWPFTKTAKAVYHLGMNLQFHKDWGASPSPEWFDHELDFVMFPQRRIVHFFERGVYASEIVEGKRVLDLCSGDGSVSALFIAPLAKSVLGVDFDKSAVDYANKKWEKFSNCSFQVQDIRNPKIKKGAFDVCLWDAAIEHFTQEEMVQILTSIKSALTQDGVLHGSTNKKSEIKGHHEHEYEFETLEELKKLVSKYFKHVKVWQREHSDRTNFYFRCSDKILETN